MSDKPNGLLLVDSCAGKPGDHRDARAVEAEGHPEPLEGSAPVSGSVSMKGSPCEKVAVILQLLKQRPKGADQLGGVAATTLQGEGDGVVFQVHVTQGEGGFRKAAALIDGNGPTDLLPLSQRRTLDGRSLLIADLGFLLHGVGLQSQFGRGILEDVVTVDGLVQDESEDSEVMNGRVPADAVSGPSVFLFHAPIQIVEAHLARDLAGGMSLIPFKELHEVLEGAKVGLQRILLRLVGAGQPAWNPSPKFAVTPLLRCGGSLHDLLGSSDLPRLSGLMNGIKPLSRRLLNKFARIIEVLDPPKRTGSSLRGPLVESSHNVANVAKTQKEANSIRENQREKWRSLQRAKNSWFESMRGSFSVYQGLAFNVAENVAEFSEGRVQ